MTWFRPSSFAPALALVLAACSVAGEGGRGDDAASTGVDDDDGPTTGSTTGTGGSGVGGAADTGGAAGGGGTGGGAPDCLTTCAERHRVGAATYGTLHTCVYCKACYSPCGGSSFGCGAPGEPSSCESSEDCGACQACALEGECSEALAACEMEADCVEYGNCIAGCAKQ